MSADTVVLIIYTTLYRRSDSQFPVVAKMLAHERSSEPHVIDRKVEGKGDD